MTEPESHTLALRRIDEMLDRLGSELRTEVSELRTEVGARLERIEDELLVLKWHRPAPGGPGDGDYGAEGDAR